MRAARGLLTGLKNRVVIRWHAFSKLHFGGSPNLLAGRRAVTSMDTSTGFRNFVATGSSVYDGHVDSGLLDYSTSQAQLIRQLDRLGRRIVDHEALVTEYMESVSAASVADSDDEEVVRESPLRRTPRGMYIWGGVGTGKSLCMDLFFQTCNLPAHRKRRVHFHNFMLEVHAKIRSFKLGQDLSQTTDSSDDSFSEQQSSSIPKNLGKLDLSSEADALQNVAHELSKECKLLCFDEFQVTDIADALIMNKLFSTLLSNGTVVVATSNRPISDLYSGSLPSNARFRTYSWGIDLSILAGAGGLNRQYFMPFLEMFQRFVSEVHIDVDTDYRITEVCHCIATQFPWIAFS